MQKISETPSSMRLRVEGSVAVAASLVAGVVALAFVPSMVPEYLHKITQQPDGGLWMDFYRFIDEKNIEYSALPLVTAVYFALVGACCCGYSVAAFEALQELDE